MTSTGSLNGHFYGPSSVSLGTHQDPSALVNQLQFNLRTPYSIESMKSNFEKPKPVLIEKFPPALINGYRSMSPILSHGVPSSPVPSLSNERLNFAVQLAKVDAKKLWKKQKEQEMIDDLTTVTTKDLKKIKSTANQKMTKQIPKKAVKKERETRVKDDDFYQRIRTQLHTESGRQQSKEIKRLEKQIQNYLKKLEDLIHKGKDEIHNKDKKVHFQQKKENVSVLSDDDTDQRQHKRSEEHASRSARILYTIECQIQQLEDEIRKNGRDVKERRKIQSLEGRLAAAQRATIRALRMLINSAPLQPKNCQYYQTLFQTLTSLIQQLSDLSLLMENQGNEDTSIHKRLKKYNETKTSDPLKAFELSSNRDVNKKSLERNFPHFPLEFFNENDSTLTVDPSPDRNATLKSAVQALMREKALEKKIGDRKRQLSLKSEKTRLKSVLLPKTLQFRKYGFNPSDKTVKVPENLSNFKKETKSSIQKKVVRQKTKTKVSETKSKKKKGCIEDIVVVPNEKITVDYNDKDKSELNNVKVESNIMDIPKNLIVEAEKQIKNRLQPLLDKAEIVVSKTRKNSIHTHFGNVISKVTMNENELLSDMILDDILLDTAQELQRLEDEQDILSDESSLENSLTLDNIFKRLEQFEKEEKRLRRSLNHVVYTDTYCTEQKNNPKSCLASSDERVTVYRRDASLKHFTKSNYKSSLSLPLEIQNSIFSYRERFLDYLQRSRSGKSTSFDPGNLIEKLSEEIFDEIIEEVAREFTGACDNISEMMFQSEFLKEQ